MKPSLFIACSVEGLPVAYAIQQNLEYACEPTVWSQGTFAPEHYNIENLVEAAETASFGIFVVRNDDVVRSRGADASKMRDNVVFELGLFIGKLGRKRCFLVAPRGASVSLPTDLHGLNPLTYDADREDENLRAALGPACHEIVEATKRLGAFDSRSSPRRSPTTVDAGDILAIVEHKISRIPPSDGPQLINVRDLERELRIPEGTATSAIRSVCAVYGLRIKREGAGTLLLVRHDP